MKVTGIILLVFAALNFMVAIMASSNGASDAAGQKMSATLLLGIIGGLLYYFGNRKKEAEESFDNKQASGDTITSDILDKKETEPKRRFDDLAIDNFLGFCVKKTTLDEIVSVLKQKTINYNEYPSYSREDEKYIAFLYEAGNIKWDCRLTIRNNKLGFISINNYDSNSYHTYKILCSEMSTRFSATHNISNSQDKMEGTETTCFTSKEDGWCFTEIVYDSSPILDQKNVYIKFFN